MGVLFPRRSLSSLSPAVTGDRAVRGHARQLRWKGTGRGRARGRALRSLYAAAWSGGAAAHSWGAAAPPWTPRPSHSCATVPAGGQGLTVARCSQPGPSASLWQEEASATSPAPSSPLWRPPPRPRDPWPFTAPPCNLCHRECMSPPSLWVLTFIGIKPPPAAKTLIRRLLPLHVTLSLKR